MKVTLVASTPDALQVIEQAASHCYRSVPTPDGRIARQCYLSGHLSVFEHVSFTWRIEGISRAALAQLTRHRIGVAFTVESQRYNNIMKQGEGLQFVTPPMIQENEEATKVYQTFMFQCLSAYTKLCLCGISSEDARFVLPNATVTNLSCSLNLRELAHLCNERLCSRAQWEIRDMVKEMVRTVNEATNDAFAYMLVPKCEQYGIACFCTEGVKSCGHHPQLEDMIKVNGGKRTHDVV